MPWAPFLLKHSRVRPSLACELQSNSFQELGLVWPPRPRRHSFESAYSSDGTHRSSNNSSPFNKQSEILFCDLSHAVSYYSSSGANFLSISALLQHQSLAYTGLNIKGALVVEFLGREVEKFYMQGSQCPQSTHGRLPARSWQRTCP